MTFLSSWLFLGVILLVSVVGIIPVLLRVCGRVIGQRLQLSSQERRRNIVARARGLDREYQRRIGKVESAVDEEDWETVGSHGVHSDKNDVDGKSWEGIVGFFHPFRSGHCYLYITLEPRRQTDAIVIVMMVEEVSESCG